MGLNILQFDPNRTTYKIAVLIKDRALKKKEVLQHYVEPLVEKGFRISEILAINLQYNDQDKAPVKLIKSHLEEVVKVLEKLDIKHVLVADAAYFKTLCKLKKAEPYFGYSLPTIYAPIRAALTINYQQLFFNPSLNQKLLMGLQAISADILGGDELFKKSIFGDVTFPDTDEDIEAALVKLHAYPKLTCDIETTGLHLKKGRILTIAVAWNKNDGFAFRWSYARGKLFKRFLKEYDGTLIFHNASFDTSRLIRTLFMQRERDIPGMLRGLDCLYGKTEDTQILAYLSLNSTAGNKLSLKDLAFEYTGNYALDDIENPESIDPETLLQYNVTDCLATWFVYDKYKPIVEAQQKEIYENLFKPTLKVITQMELCGIPLDKKQVGITGTELNSIRSAYYSKISKNPLVLHFENELRIQTALDATAKLKKKVKTKDDYLDLNFNPRSSKHLRELLYDNLKLPVLKTTDTGLPSTDGKTLQALINHLKTTYKI